MVVAKTELGPESETEPSDDSDLDLAEADPEGDEQSPMEDDGGDEDGDGFGALARRGDRPDKAGAPLSASFEGIKLRLRKISKGRCTIGVDLELAFEEAKPGSEKPPPGAEDDESEPEEQEQDIDSGEDETDEDEQDIDSDEDETDESEQDIDSDEDETDEGEQDIDSDEDETDEDEQASPRAGGVQKFAASSAQARPRMAKKAPALSKATAKPKVKVADVQPGSKNKSVLIVQKALAKAVGLDYSSGPGHFGPATKAAYAKWQRKCGYSGSAADGKPGAASLKKLAAKYGFQVDTSTPPPLKVKFDRKKFFQGYTATIGRLNQSQKDGLNALLKAAEGDSKITDIRWLAYMFATVEHECDHTWKPIKEYSRGAGRPYGNAVTVKDPQGKKYTNVYYGRGYVQLTWKDNYARMGKRLKNRLLYEPALALKPSVAYQIMSLGMREGLFTPHKLSDYINGAKADYVGARRIINGQDRAQTIARYAIKLEKILRRSAVPAARKAPTPSSP
jgi:peptidoglycan hydrolase-like protein with peptidoglycan-binding domain